jgi:hypothetical protein
MHVSLARTFRVNFGLLYKRDKVLMGWLHDASITDEIDIGKQPEMDKDQWIQYFVQAIELLGTKMIFIEFVFSFGQWADEKELDDDISKIWCD